MAALVAENQARLTAALEIAATKANAANSAGSAAPSAARRRWTAGAEARARAAPTRRLKELMAELAAEQPQATSPHTHAVPA